MRFATAFFLVLTVSSAAAFAGPPAHDKNGDPIQTNHVDLMQSLESAETDARAALTGIALKWENLPCGKLVKDNEEMVSKTKVTFSMKSGMSVYMKSDLGVQQNANGPNQLEITVDDKLFAKNESAEIQGHAYAGMIAGQFFSHHKNHGASYRVGECVINYLKERDLNRSAVDPTAGSSDSTSSGAR